MKALKIVLPDKPVLYVPVFELGKSLLFLFDLLKGVDIDDISFSVTTVDL